MPSTMSAWLHVFDASPLLRTYFLLPFSPVCAFLLPHPDNPKLVDPRFLEVFFTLVLRLAAKLDDGLTLAFDEVVYASKKMR